MHGYGIISIHAETAIGFMDRCLFDPDTLTCALVVLRQSSFIKKNYRYILWNDVLEISNHIYVQSEDVACEKDDLVRFERLIEQDCSLIGMKVITKSGKLIGAVYNYVFDTKTGSLVSLYVKSPALSFKEDRIIAKDYIIDVKNDTIIITGDKPLQTLSEHEKSLKQLSTQVPIHTIDK